MTDLYQRFAELDTLETPDLRAEIERRAAGEPMVVLARDTVSVPSPPLRRGWGVAVAMAVVVLVVVGGLAVVFGGSEGSVPPAGQTPPVPSETVTSPLHSVPEARVRGLPFSFADDDLCEWFTADEILTIVASAYEAEGVGYPLPDTVVADSERIRNDRPGCDWTVPGTPGGWGRPDFTVMFRDDSDYRLATDTGGDGPTLLESFHDPSPDSYVQPLDTDNLRGKGVLDLTNPGVIDVGGWSPGFGVYIEKTDRLVDFRHDLSADVEEENENYRVEYRILNEMLNRMNWLPNPERSG